MRKVPFGTGLTIDIPAAWSLDGIGFVNRATQRLLIASNGDLTVPTVPGNGDIDAAALPTGRVVLGIESFCRFSCQGPTAESSMPLDWSAAAPFQARSLPADRHELALGFRWFDQPMFVVARWADGAPADVALIPSIVASIRADPTPPTNGEYFGWDAVAPVADVPVGSVRFELLPPGAIVQQPFRVWDVVPFFVVRGRLNTYAFVSRPLHDQSCVIHYDWQADRFSCEAGGRMYEWTRFGRYLGPEPNSDLSQHRVIVRDGLVWVKYVDDSLLVPSVQDEAAERAP